VAVGVVETGEKETEPEVESTKAQRGGKDQEERVGREGESRTNMEPGDDDGVINWV